MISHEHKCIFVHQRKCAGCSIINAFGFDVDDPEWHFMNDGVLSPEYQDAPNYFKFAVVRNPWDRFVSGWKYLESTRAQSLRQVLTKLPESGKDYRHLTRPQSATLFDGSGRLIVDYLIRFESLQQGFDEVCEVIGKPRRRLPHLNQTARDHYRNYFDDECRELFLRHFARDVEIFGYQY
ncbi:MAG TPA: sulfotransferase family 2 domain-containing protein [Pyrinomonadaceae bacterium]|nr:sulfotransferase family 2 domain-containing protein [Pyrinomonadaceae bacterium]